MRQSRRGESLVELLVALLILEVAGILALTGALTLERLGRHARDGGSTDRARWEGYRAAEVAPACTGAGAPTAVALTLPATAERPVLATIVRCGP